MKKIIIILFLLNLVFQAVKHSKIAEVKSSKYIYAKPKYIIVPIGNVFEDKYKEKKVLNIQ